MKTIMVSFAMLVSLAACSDRPASNASSVRHCVNNLECGKGEYCATFPTAANTSRYYDNQSSLYRDGFCRSMEEK